MRDPGIGLVYFAQRASDGAIKIGFTAKTNHSFMRYRALELQFRTKVAVLGEIRGTVGFERHIHHGLNEFRLAPYRMPNCEWFRPVPEVIATVDLLLMTDGWTEQLPHLHEKNHNPRVPSNRSRRKPVSYVRPVRLVSVADDSGLRHEPAAGVR